MLKWWTKFTDAKASRLEVLENVQIWWEITKDETNLELSSGACI